MLWTIFVILLVLWLLGLVSSYTLGGFIHILSGGRGGGTADPAAFRSPTSTLTRIGGRFGRQHYRIPFSGRVK